MSELIGYIIKNKEWIFSGIGIPVLLFLLKILSSSKSSGTKKNKQKTSTLIIGSNNKSKVNQKNGQ
ncbi:hypothetical protein [Pantoea sp. Lu_F5_004]|jgi:uncharacterized phage infection (PIP) family protein YhgE|uniref:hypothetical protein n=1 Tax=Pantoea sp. Lu_F5_004 TaxID=3443507 RepID=UPI003EBF5798